MKDYNPYDLDQYLTASATGFEKDLKNTIEAHFEKDLGTRIPCDLTMLRSLFKKLNDHFECLRPAGRGLLEYSSRGGKK